MKWRYGLCVTSFLTRESWPSALIGAVPEAEPLVVEHLDNNDQLLLHLLMGDVTRFVEAAYEGGDLMLASRCLAFLDLSLREGDEDVQNAVSVSFVENVGPWDSGKASFIAAWPDALRADAVRFG